VKSQPVEFLEPVEHDLRYAHEFYNSWKTKGAVDFQERFRECVSWIEWNPDMFPKQFRVFRRAIIRRSYFAAYYAIESGVTTVVAVLDMRREPQSIQKLLKGRRP
jgi:hypothetical protein